MESVVPATLETPVEAPETSVPCERGVLRLPPFALCSGERLDGGELAWQVWGVGDAPVAIVLGGILGHATISRISQARFDVGVLVASAVASAGGAPTPVPWSESRGVLAALADAVALADRR